MRRALTVEVVRILGVMLLPRDIVHCSRRERQSWVSISQNGSLDAERSTGRNREVGQVKLTQVGWECEKFLADQHQERINRRIPKYFVPVDLVAGPIGNSKVLAGLRDVDFVAFHGGVITMVAVVRDFPGEVGCPKKGM